MRSTASQPLRTVNLNQQSGSGRYQGVLSEDSSSQSYRLRLTQRSSLNLALSNLKTNADLTLLDRSGKVIDRSSRNGQTAESIAQTLSAGTYYVRVERQQGKTSYRLNVSLEQSKSTDLASVPTASVSPAPAASLAEQVLTLVNQQRQAAGVKPLQLNDQLTATATAHSQDMALNDYFGHPGLDGRSPEARILAGGYNAFITSENIAAGLASPESVVQAWMDSPGHRANILNGKLSEMGVGFYFLENELGSTNYRYYWTQDFGQPMV